jgi:hypothetical protein
MISNKSVCRCKIQNRSITVTKTLECRSSIMNTFIFNQCTVSPIIDSSNIVLIFYLLRGFCTMLFCVSMYFFHFMTEKKCDYVKIFSLNVLLFTSMEPRIRKKNERTKHMCFFIFLHTTHYPQFVVRLQPSTRLILQPIEKTLRQGGNYLEGEYYI